MKNLENYRIFDEISQITIGNDYENWCCFRLFLTFLTHFQQEFSKDATFVTDFPSENSGIFSVLSKIDHGRQSKITCFKNCSEKN